MKPADGPRIFPTVVNHQSPRTVYRPGGNERKSTNLLSSLNWRGWKGPLESAIVFLSMFVTKKKRYEAAENHSPMADGSKGLFS
jgi:hypothetical protein